jgi:hypothetical protein
MKKMINSFIIFLIVIYRSLASNATDSLITNDDKIRGSSRSEPTNIVIKDKSEILTFSYC